MSRNRTAPTGSSLTGRLARRLRARASGDDGASLVEYALLLALIAVVAIGALTFLGNTVSGTLNNVGNTIALGTSGGGGGTTTTTIATQVPSYNNLVSGNLLLAADNSPGGGATISAAATGGTTPITYSGTLPTGFSFAGGTGSNTTGAITVSHNVTTGTTTLHVVATNTAGNVTTPVVVTTFHYGSVDQISVSYNGNNCTVSGSPSTMSCSSWDWFGSGNYLYMSGAWVAVPGGNGGGNTSNSTLRNDVNYALSLGTNAWTVQTNGGRVTQVNIPNNSFPANGDLYH